MFLKAGTEALLLPSSTQSSGSETQPKACSLQAMWSQDGWDGLQLQVKMQLWGAGSFPEIISLVA